MKNNLFSFALIGCLLFALGCTSPIIPELPPNPNPNPDPVEAITAVELCNVDYLDAPSVDGKHYFTLRFASKIYSSLGRFQAEDTVFMMTVIAPSLGLDSCPPSGTYTIADENETGYVIYRPLVEISRPGVMYESFEVAEGSLTIANESGVYQINGRFSALSGELFRMHYDGTLIVPELFDYEAETTEGNMYDYAMNTLLVPMTNSGAIHNPNVDVVDVGIGGSEAVAALQFYLPAGATQLPIGTYTIDNSQAAMTVQASPGRSTRTFDKPSFVGFVDEYGQYDMLRTYYLVSGIVTVTATGFTVNAYSYLDNSIVIRYRGPIDLE